MGFTSRKGISFKSLFSVILYLWLHGNNGEESGFKIYRGERDIFTNDLDYDEISGTSSGSGSFIDQCSSYGAECIDDQCKYCRCWKGMNTFIRDPDQMEGYCKSDEDIVPESDICVHFNLHS